MTSNTFFWPCVLTEPPFMVLSETPSTLRSLERVTTATMRPALPNQERTSNARVAHKPFLCFMFEARSLADDLAIARPSFSSMIPSPFGSMRRISASCAGVRVDASRWIEVAALMLPVCGKGWEGRELPGAVDRDGEISFLMYYSGNRLHPLSVT